MKQSRVCRSLAVVAAVAGSLGLAAAVSAAPTDGWSQAGWSYQVHKPYNLSVSSRFSYSGGVWTTWVNRTDAPHQQGSTTGARTELRWLNDYTSGQRMWSGDVYIVSGSTGVSIAQIFGASGRSTATMVHANSASGGSLRLYGESGRTIATGVYNRWLNLKMAHDANANVIRMYINNSLIRTDADHGNGTHYFKNGVYAQGGASSRMEARFRSLQQWRR